MNKNVEKLIGIQITGNVIPNEWFQCIKKYDINTKQFLDKPDLHAIVILADIVYWFRPVEVRDEKTGQTIGYKQKFNSDKLQRGYDDFAQQFGLTRIQVKRAIDNLERLGFITREFRNIDYKGTKLNNILFIDLNIDVLLEKTQKIQSDNNDTLFTKMTPPLYRNVTPSLQKCKDPLTEMSTPPYISVKTPLHKCKDNIYTENTIEITNKNTIENNNISIGSENFSDSKSSTKKPKTFNEYPERIQNLIDAFIRIHNAKHPEMEQRFNSFINKDTWAKEINLVLKDKTIDLSFNELRNIIMFAAEDSFWSANLMSLSQLRKKSKSNDMPKILNLYASYKRHPDIVAKDNELDALLSRSTDNFVEAYEKEREEMDKRIQKAKQKAERKQKAIETYDWEKFLSGEQVAKTKEEKLSKYLDDERII